MCIMLHTVVWLHLTLAACVCTTRYAIAMAFRDKQRVIYTSPIKALSNQKFRELSVSKPGIGNIPN